MTKQERGRRWYEANKELTKKRALAYQRTHPEKVKQWRRTRRAKMTPEQKAAELVRFKKWQEANRDKARACCRKWYRNNKDKKRQQRKQWAKDTDYVKRHSRKERDELADRYVVRVLTQRTAIHPRDLPRMLIEAKRAELKLQRRLRNEEAEYVK